MCSPSSLKLFSFFYLSLSYTITPFSCFFLPSRCFRMLLRVLRPSPLCFSCQCICRYCLVSWFSPALPTFLRAHLPFSYAVSSFCRSALSTLCLVLLSCSTLAGATVETLSLTPRPNISLFSRGLFSTHHLPCSFGIVSALLFPISHLLAEPLHTCVVCCSALGLSILRHICLSPVSSQRFCWARNSRRVPFTSCAATALSC